MMEVRAEFTAKIFKTAKFFEASVIRSEAVWLPLGGFGGDSLRSSDI